MAYHTLVYLETFEKIIIQRYKHCHQCFSPQQWENWNLSGILPLVVRDTNNITYMSTEEILHCKKKW